MKHLPIIRTSPQLDQGLGLTVVGFWVLMGVFILHPRSAQAQERTSADYGISAEIFSAGGGSQTGGAVKQVETGGAVAGGAELGGQTTVLSGWVAQLAAPAALQVTLPSSALAEASAGQLSASLLWDDLSVEILLPSSVTWQVLSGPVAGISAGGAVTANAVYQNEAASVQGTAQGLTDDFPFTVTNTNIDNFGSYAGDTIDDLWQVQYFGLNNLAAGPNRDPDGDSQNNLLEYNAGTIPNSAVSRFIYTVSRAPNGLIGVQFTPWFADRTYSLRGSGDLNLWSAVPGSVVTNLGGGNGVAVDPVIRGLKYFYRLEVTKQN